MKVELYLPPYAKTNSKWIKDLNIRPKIIELIEGNIGQKLHGIEFGNDFLDMTLKVHSMTEKG